MLNVYDLKCSIVAYGEIVPWHWNVCGGCVEDLASNAELDLDGVPLVGVYGHPGRLESDFLECLIDKRHFGMAIGQRGLGS